MKIEILAKSKIEKNGYNQACHGWILVLPLKSIHDGRLDYTIVIIHSRLIEVCIVLLTFLHLLSYGGQFYIITPYFWSFVIMLLFLLPTYLCTIMLELFSVCLLPWLSYVILVFYRIYIMSYLSQTLMPIEYLWFWYLYYTNLFVHIRVLVVVAGSTTVLWLIL